MKTLFALLCAPLALGILVLFAIDDRISRRH